MHKFIGVNYLTENTQQTKSLSRITITYAMQNLIANLTSVALNKFSNSALSTEILQLMNKVEKKMNICHICAFTKLPMIAT